MNIRDLEYIVALADKKSFGAAAKTCNVSQPALSSQVKKLEDYLGIRLFERAPGGVEPTENAAFVIHSARLILEKAAAIRHHARQIAKNRQPRQIGLGVIPTVAPYYLSKFFKAIEPVHLDQSVRWRIVEDKTEHLRSKLDRGEIDAAILVVPLPDTDLAQCQILEEELYLAVPKAHPLADRPCVTARDIENETWILLDDGHCLNVPMLDICGKAHIDTEHNSFRATSLETVRQMVAQNSGITLMPEMARRQDDGIAYIPIKAPIPYRRAIGLAWRRTGLHADVLGAVRDHLTA